MTTSKESGFPALKYKEDFYTLMDEPIVSNQELQNYKYFVYRENKENAQLLVDIWRLIDAAIKNIQNTPNAQIEFEKQYDCLVTFKEKIEQVARSDNIGYDPDGRFKILGRRSDYQEIKEDAERGDFSRLKGNGREEDLLHIQKQTIADAAISVLNDLRLELSNAYDLWKKKENNEQVRETATVMTQYHNAMTIMVNELIEIQKCFKNSNGSCNVRTINLNSAEDFEQLKGEVKFKCPLSAVHKCRGDYKQRCQKCCRCRWLKYSEHQFMVRLLQENLQQPDIAKEIIQPKNSRILAEHAELIKHRGKLVTDHNTFLIDNSFPSLVKILAINPELYMSCKQQLYDMHILLSQFDNEISQFQGEPDVLTKFAFEISKPKTTPFDRQQNYQQDSLQGRLQERVRDGSLYYDRQMLKDSLQFYQDPVELPPQQDLLGQGPQKSLMTQFEIGGEEKMDSSTIDMLRALTGDFNLIN